MRPLEPENKGLLRGQAYGKPGPSQMPVDVLSEIRRRPPANWGPQSLHCLDPCPARVEFVRISRMSVRTTGHEDRPVTFWLLFGHSKSNNERLWEWLKRGP